MLSRELVDTTNIQSQSGQDSKERDLAVDATIHCHGLRPDDL